MMARIALARAASRVCHTPSICRPSNVLSRKMSEQFVVLPEIMESKKGVVDKWLKKQGDKIVEHEPICQITLENNLSIEFDAPTEGYLASILVQPGVECKVGDQLAMYVTSKEEYWKYLDKLRMTTEEDQKLDQVGHNLDDNDKELTKYLLREIRKLTKSGAIESESEFTRELMYLARKGNEDVLNLFESCFDSLDHAATGDSFDSSFFLENVMEIVQESLEKKKNKCD